MRKKIILIIIILALVLTGLVACDTGEELEYPIEWRSYIDEVANYSYRTLRDAYNSYSLSLNAEMYHTVMGVQTKYSATLKITQDMDDKDNSAIEVRVVANNVSIIDREVFYLGANNTTTYLLAQGLYSDYGRLRYQFENTPIFDLLNVSIANPFNLKQNIAKALNKVATYCEINVDKDEFIISVDFADIIEANASSIAKALAILPQPIVKEINALFNCDIMDWSEVLGGTTAKLKCNINNNLLVGVELYDISAPKVDDSSRIDRIYISDITVSEELNTELAKSINENKKNYIPTKIGTFSLYGNISLADESMRNLAIKYDYKMNASIDLLELVKNNYDFGCLDDRNYFHFRLSHICDSDCGAFCSILNGNKFSSGKGAIIDVAFSPKDFGTHNIYIAVGIKQIIGEKVVELLAGKSANLALIALPDYLLLTLDSSIFISSGDSSSEDTLKPIIGMLENIDINERRTVIDINELFKLLNVPSSPMVDALLNSAGYNVEKLIMTYDKPTFGYVTDYDIARDTLVIIDNNYSGTKVFYKNYIVGEVNPSLSWSFNDYNLLTINDEQQSIHNIYQGNDNLIFSSELPLSPQEAMEMKGKYIKYDYIDTKGQSITGNNARIIELQDIDYTLLDCYQKVKLRVELPSNWLGSIADALGRDKLEWLYTTVETNIRLTAIADNGISIERTDIGTDGNLILSYKLSRISGTPPMLKGKVNITYADGRSKTLDLIGKSDAIALVVGLTSSTYYIDKIGDYAVVFNYAGYTQSHMINVVKPDNIYLERTNKNSIFKTRVEITYSTFRLFSIAAVYDGVKVSIPLYFENYSIDGESLAVDGRYWWGYSSVNNEQILRFLADGKYIVQVEAYGLSAEVEIEVTSRVYEPSRYKVVDLYPEYNQYYSGIYRTQAVEIINTFHGAIGLNDLMLNIEVSRRTINEIGYEISQKLEYGEGSYMLKGIKLNYNEIQLLDPDNLISIPPSISNTLGMKISYYIMFAKAGKYNVKLTLGSSLNLFKDFYVADIPVN